MLFTSTHAYIGSGPMLFDGVVGEAYTAVFL